MTLPEFPMSAWAANSVFIGVYGLLILDRFPRVAVSLLGALILIVFAGLPFESAMHAVDFNVIALLVGMMMLVGYLKRTGAMEALAQAAVRFSRGNGVRLMLLLCLMTALLSALLDNVTTVLLMGGMTVAIGRQLRLNPVPLLIAEVIASNIGGAATYIGDPPNIMIGSAAQLTFMDFIVHLAPVILLGVLPTGLLTLTVLYRRQLRLSFGARRASLRQRPLEAIRNARLLRKTGIVLACVVVGFLTHHVLHVEAGVIAMIGAAVMLAWAPKQVVWNEVEWETVFFFIGLFILVEALVQAGTLAWLSRGLLQATEGDFRLTALSLLWASGILSAVVDNIPYTATMIPLVSGLKTLDAAHFSHLQPLWWALALGACLGGNGTLIGATANVIVADMAARQGSPIRFLEFAAVGGLITLQSLVICTAYLWFRYL